MDIIGEEILGESDSKFSVKLINFDISFIITLKQR